MKEKKEMFILLALVALATFFLGRSTVPTEERFYSISQEEKDCIAKEGELRWKDRSAIDDEGRFHYGNFYCVRLEKVI